MTLMADLALQQAIYAELSTDSALGALVGDRIYDEVPGGTAFPYLTLGESRMEAWTTGTEDGATHRIRLSAYSRAGGRSEVKRILGLVHGLLDDADLMLAGHELISMNFNELSTAREPNGITWRGVVGFRAVTEPL